MRQLDIAKSGLAVKDTELKRVQAEILQKNALLKRWRAENERRVALAAAEAPLTKNLSPSSEERVRGKGHAAIPGHLGLIVDFVGRTVRRDGYYSEKATVFLANRKFWPVFEAIYKAGPSGIAAEDACSLYDGSPEDCRMAVSYYRGVLATRLEVTIANRKWALVDVKDLKNRRNRRS